MDKEKTTFAHIRIEGRVQGVWFRGWTVQEARHLNLSGWVRNRRDGTVEAFFQGDEASVNKMVYLCFKGPPSALVTKVIPSPNDSFVPVVEEGVFKNLPTY